MNSIRILVMILIAPAAFVGATPARPFQFTSSFQAFLAPNKPQAVAAADLNRDGKADLVCTGTDSVYIFLATTESPFFQQIQELPNKNSSPVYGYAGSFAIGNVNGDSIPDLAIPNNAGASVAIWHGDGSGRMIAAGEYATGAGPSAVALADFNRDGYVDFVSANNGAGTITLWQGSSSFAFDHRTDIAVGTYTSFLAVGDLNRDGNPDVVVNGLTQVSLLLGNGDGTFRKTQLVPGQWPAFALGDVNGDGFDDVVLAGRNPSVCPGNGDGNTDIRLLGFRIDRDRRSERGSCSRSGRCRTRKRL